MSEPFEQLKSSIVRFYHANGNGVGAGFLVAERYVLTCAHVVTEALALPRDTQEVPKQPVQIEFPLALKGQKVEAVVAFWLPVSDTADAEDIAVLKLLMPSPVNAKPVKVAASSGTWGHSLRIFGFPRADTDGVWATATLREQTGKWIQLDAQAGQDRPIEKGYSGAPVWDEQLNAVVGMTVAAEKNRQPSVTSAYMVAKDLLNKPLNYVRRQALLDILQPFEQDLEFFIGLAYGLSVSRKEIVLSEPKTFKIVDALSNLGSGAVRSEDKLVQFVAALWLVLADQPFFDIRNSLELWGRRFAKDFEKAKVAMRSHRAMRQAEIIHPLDPMLLISIQKDVSQDIYYFDVWLIPNPSEYKARSCRGCYRLLLEKNGKSYDSSKGVSYDELIVLIGDYLRWLDNDGMEVYFEQTCGSSDLDFEFDPCELTICFSVSPSLLNQPLERLQPGGVQDAPLGISDDACPHVVFALRERLHLSKAWNPKSRWKKAWKTVTATPEEPLFAHQVFVEKSGLDRKGAMGLKLFTSIDSQKDVEILARKGIPLALWIRDNQANLDWASILHQKVLIHPIKELLERVSELRRNTKFLDSEVDYAGSEELGHHLAILWDDPNRVPPTMTAPLSAAKL